MWNQCFISITNELIKQLTPVVPCLHSKLLNFQQTMLTVDQFAITPAFFVEIRPGMTFSEFCATYCVACVDQESVIIVEITIKTKGDTIQSLSVNKSYCKIATPMEMVLV
jgi:hypothetical protein